MILYIYIYIGSIINFLVDTNTFLFLFLGKLQKAPLNFQPFTQNTPKHKKTLIYVPPVIFRFLSLRTLLLVLYPLYPHSETTSFWTPKQHCFGLQNNVVLPKMV
jgi:hypothetical protein